MLDYYSKVAPLPIDIGINEPLYTSTARTVVAPMLKLQRKHVRGAPRLLTQVRPSTRLADVLHPQSF